MADLAYNINGEPFELPSGAVNWRVRRMKQRGAPEVVYGRDGLPLVIAIDADLDELRRNIDAPGRFRLDAIDDRGRVIEDLPAAYVMVASTIQPPATTAGAPLAPIQSSEGVVAEAMRLNTELARTIVDRFPEMMHAAAELLRAADGAGLPARAPRVIAVDDDDDENDDNDAAPGGLLPGGIDLNAIVAQVVSGLVQSVMTGGKLPSVASMLDWRKATPAEATEKKASKAPKATAPAAAQAASANVDTKPAPHNNDAATPNTAELPPIDAATMAHFIAIQAQLTPDEAQLARSVASELSPVALRAWFDELKKLSVPEAVQKIRVLVAGNTEAAS